jgi:hypothetical protein
MCCHASVFPAAVHFATHKLIPTYGAMTNFTFWIVGGQGSHTYEPRKRDVFCAPRASLILKEPVVP